MRRRLRFPITFRERIASNEAALKAMSSDGKLPEALQRGFDELRPPPPRKRLPRLDAPTEPLERDIQSAIMEALLLHPRVVKAVRTNSGAAMYKSPQGRDYMVHFTSEPVVDIHFMLRNPHGWGWFEVKRPSFRSPRDLREERQAAFLAAVREAGGIGEFVRSVTETIAAIER